MINRLDNELAAYLASQEAFKEDPKQQARLTVRVDKGFALRKYLDPKRLQGRLDRIAEYKFVAEHLDYLRVIERFDDAYLDYLETSLLPAPKVLARGDDIKVQVDGTLAELALWEVPISTQIHDLYFSGVLQENGLDRTALMQEGVRRLQVKNDMLRNSATRFVEAGTRTRYAFDWHVLVFQLLLGDVPDLLVGTTNLNMAMAFGLLVWPFTPDVTRVRVGPLSVRDMQRISDEASGGAYVVQGLNAFEMAHMRSHLGEDLIFEWGTDLTSDMGPGGIALPLSCTTE